MNNLVEVIGNKGEERVVVTSRSVAEYFEKRHDHVIRDIKNIIGGLPKIGDTPELFFETTYVSEQNGQKYPMFLMNRDGFSLLTMGFTGEKALSWKLKYISAFNQMEDMLKRLSLERTNTLLERVKCKGVRNALTDVIKNMVADSPHKKFAYANYTKLIYKICFGMTMDELRAKYGATTKESVRDLMSADDLAEVSHKESLVCGLINEGWGYKEIRNFMEANCRPAIEPSLKLDTAN